MIYKIGTTEDMKKVDFGCEVAREVCLYYATILTESYGIDRNIDTNNGGYILYATEGTNSKNIKNVFDYTDTLPEFVDIKDGICSAVYIISSDYGIVIVMSVCDAPPEILNKIDN